GVGLWSTRPPDAGFQALDVSSEVDSLVERADTAAGPEGDATIATYTVLFDDSQPVRAAVVADRADGTRAVAVNSDAAVAAAMTADEWCGRPVRLDGAGSFEPT